MPEGRNKQQLSRSYSIIYDSSNHWQVLTQCWGSLWPRVLPYCLFNTALMVAITYATPYLDVSLNISNQGHVFVSMVVAYLLVSRVNMALTRFNEARAHLESMFRETRELIQTLAVVSQTGNSDPVSKEWRLEVAYRMLLLLRTAMAVVDFPEHEQPAWMVPELHGKELQDIMTKTYLNPANHEFLYEPRTNFEESMRVPVRISYLLMQSIHSHHFRLQKPLNIMFENRLLASVSSFMAGYYGYVSASSILVCSFFSFLAGPFP